MPEVDDEDFEPDYKNVRQYFLNYLKTIKGAKKEEI